MYKTYITIFFALTLLLTACRKDDAPAALANGSVSIEVVAGKDTVERSISILSDTATVIGLTATLSGSPSSSDHYVNFGIDTTKIVAYRKLYGDALLLPSTSYYFYKPQVRIPAGSLVSEQGSLNLILQTKLLGYSTYVLPVVIKDVDGLTEGTQTTRVIYYVFKTGRPAVIDKIGWTISSFSSFNGTFVAANVIDDNNLTTYWTSNISGLMPQSIAINFNKNVTFSAVNYYVPAALAYPKNGGYPTSILIETSLDGITWVNRGTYTGNIVNNMQTLNTGVITAKYLRFTSLASVKYLSTYSVIFISGISLMP